jgi:hypothetical protein
MNYPERPLQMLFISTTRLKLTGIVRNNPLQKLQQGSDPNFKQDSNFKHVEPVLNKFLIIASTFDILEHQSIERIMHGETMTQ